ncbi:MAG: hypothetical protein ABSG88_08195 [Bradyrhizobium sp.]
MTLTVREMTDSEFEFVIDYFFKSTPEHLEALGVTVPGPLDFHQAVTRRVLER